MARPGGLGRGLGALIPTGTVAEQAGGLAEIPTAEIRPNPQQPRQHFDEEALAALADSIREVGILQPVLVRAGEGGGFELIAGERRWRAARRVGLQTVPAMVRVADDAAMLQHAIVENVQREELNPLEEAGAYQQLIEDFSLTHDDVATRVGKSRATITNTLRLLQLPPSIQRCLKDGTIRMGHARALLGTPDRGFQEELAKRVIAEDLSVRQVEDAIRNRQEPATPPTETAAAVADPGGRLRPPGLLELEELLGDYLETRVKITMGARHGRVQIDFANLEDLERIYRAMSQGPVRAES
ncbi:MAG: ParB family transcriptional regulator, chromosome partitioning protein [Actinomycetota bacterium]|nr:ParB family transcriptional regulator, chromosome partitioning protein [Actinomycetota bacterium]